MWSANFSYSDLSGNCSFSVKNADEGIVREGVAALWVKWHHPKHSTKVVPLWQQPVQFSISANVTSVLESPMRMGGGIVLFSKLSIVGKFQSKVQVFTGKDASEVDFFPTLSAGEPVYMEQGLVRNLNGIKLEIVMVFLSESKDPEKTALHTYYSKDIQVHQDKKTSIRFSITAKKCKKCFIHTISKIVHHTPRMLSGFHRRLEDGQKNDEQTTWARTSIDVGDAQAASDSNSTAVAAGTRFEVQHWYILILILVSGPLGLF